MESRIPPGSRERDIARAVDLLATATLVLIKRAEQATNLAEESALAGMSLRARLATYLIAGSLTDDTLLSDPSHTEQDPLDLLDEVRRLLEPYATARHGNVDLVIGAVDVTDLQHDLVRHVHGP